MKKSMSAQSEHFGYHFKKNDNAYHGLLLLSLDQRPAKHQCCMPTVTGVNALKTRYTFYLRGFLSGVSLGSGQSKRHIIQ